MNKEVIGIDFGSSSSCVAVFKNNAVDVVANENGNRSTPSVVAYLESGETLVGDEALSQISRNAANTITNMKSIIGRKFADLENEKTPFSIVQKKADKGRDVSIEVNQGGKSKHLSPETVTSCVFAKLKEIAEHSIGSKVSRVVLAVPSYFDEDQKRALKDASTSAGLEVLRIMPEPIAVALARMSELDNKDKTASTTIPSVVGERNMLVFDHGSSLNISVVGIVNGLIELKANARDTKLGGSALDSLLVQHFVSDFTRKNRGKDIKSNARALAKLTMACERAKRSLSSSGQASIEIDGLYEGQDYNGNVSRARFEDMASSHSKACLAVVSKCLEECGLTKQQITDVVMVGGGARVPILQTAVATFFEGLEISRGVNPEEAIAMGACYQGIALNGNTVVPKVLQTAIEVKVLPHNIGLELSDGQLGVVLPKGSVLPVKKVISLSTHEDNQTAVFLQVYEGDDTIAKKNTLLGRFAITGIELEQKGIPKIRVKFEIDSSNSLQVTAESGGSKSGDDTAKLIVTTKSS